MHGIHWRLIGRSGRTLHVFLTILSVTIPTCLCMPLTCDDAKDPPPDAALYLSWSNSSILPEQVRDGKFADSGYIYENGILCDPILHFLQDELADDANNDTYAVYITCQAQLDYYWPMVNNVKMVNVSLLQERFDLDVARVKDNEGLLSLALRGGIMKEIPHGFFDSFPKLMLLDLVGNNITHLERNVFRKLSSLTLFIFSDNHLQQYDADLLCNLPSLYSITMHNVFMGGFPTIFSLTAIRGMNCSEVQSFNQTKIVRISLNYFPLIKNSSFDALYRMDNELQIAGSRIRKIESGAFDGLELLKYLFIGMNEFEELPLGLLDSLTNLREFAAEECNLQSFSAEHIPKKTRINKLNLAGNCLKNLSGSFGRLQLTHIYLDYNCLSSIHKETFSNSSDLVFIDLVANNITHIEAGAFRNVNTDNQVPLVLNLSTNRIAQLDSDMFRETFGLTVLSLGHNQISVLPPGIFSKQVELSKLYIGNNRLRNLSCTIFSELLQLTTLTLKHNEINALCPTIFEQNSKLTRLDLSSNNLDAITDTTLWPLTAIKVLRLAGNNLTYINASLLNTRSHSLTELSLADNPWNCSCQLDPLVKWLNETTLDTSDVDKMMCKSPPALSARSVANLTSEDTCGNADPVLTSSSIIVIAVLGTLLILLVTLVPLLICFRYFIYVKVGCCSCSKPQEDTAL